MNEINSIWVFLSVFGGDPECLISLNIVSDRCHGNESQGLMTNQQNNDRDDATRLHHSFIWNYSVLIGHTQYALRCSVPVSVFDSLF